eukprot:10439134-Lingulodinium_polyedra.AAC.1
MWWPWDAIEFLDGEGGAADQPEEAAPCEAQHKIKHSGVAGLGATGPLAGGHLRGHGQRGPARAGRPSPC